MTLGSSPRSVAVDLIAVHTTEGITRAKDLGPFFEREYAKNPAGAGSSHAAVDDTELVPLVPFNRAAWTIRSGNLRTDNIELCGFAKWTRAEWLQHRPMLALTSDWLRSRCIARGVPFRKLSPDQLKAGVKGGVIGHVDWTNGMNDGSHWDPGPNFPWDIVMAGTPGQPTIKETIMALSDVASLKIIKAPGDTPWFITNGMRKRILRGSPDGPGTPGEPDYLIMLGLAEWHIPKGEAGETLFATVPQWFIDSLPNEV